MQAPTKITRDSRRQPQDGEDPRARNPPDTARPRRRGDRMKQQSVSSRYWGRGDRVAIDSARGRAINCQTPTPTRWRTAPCAGISPGPEGRGLCRARRWLSNTAGPNQMDRLPELAADLIRRQVSVCDRRPEELGAALAAKAATADPYSFCCCGGPMTGLVTSLARPTGNLTGIKLSVVASSIAQNGWNSSVKWCLQPLGWPFW